MAIIRVGARGGWRPRRLARRERPAATGGGPAGGGGLTAPEVAPAQVRLAHRPADQVVGEQRVHDDAGREDVGGGRPRRPVGQLRRLVALRAAEVVRHANALYQARVAEVAQLDLRRDGGGHQDVLELDVAMQHAVRVHARERAEQLLHDRVHGGLCEGSVTLEELLAVAAGHQVEHDRQVLGAHVEAPAADDVRVHALAQQLDLVLEVDLRRPRVQSVSTAVCEQPGGSGGAPSVETSANWAAAVQACMPPPRQWSCP